MLLVLSLSSALALWLNKISGIGRGIGSIGDLIGEIKKDEAKHDSLIYRISFFSSCEARLTVSRPDYRLRRDGNVAEYLIQVLGSLAPMFRADFCVSTAGSAFRAVSFVDKPYLRLANNEEIRGILWGILWNKTKGSIYPEIRLADICM
jgi:hypothetical protein